MTSRPSPLTSLVAAASALLAAALWSTPALAGGIGLVGVGGVHSDRVDSYSYDDALQDYVQENPEHQFNGDYGGGVEVVLGDKDNKVLGIFRGYYLGDAPQSKPEKGDTFAIRTEVRPIATLSAGLQWGIVGDASKLQLVVTSTIGSGITSDFSDFAMAELGVGGTWMAARKVQVSATIGAGTRYRKIFYPTVNGYAGVRYLFD
jgi:hypothetical protein